jgi:transcriptional regulator with XRE-family HTH domain
MPERDALAAFAARLHEACDAAEIPQRGRQSALALRLKVSYQAVKKWLDGVGFPDLHRAVALADELKVNVTWLLQGNGPMRGERVDDSVRLVVEAIDALPREERTRVLAFLSFEMSQRPQWFAEEARVRYADAIAKFANRDDNAGESPAPGTPRH